MGAVDKLLKKNILSSESSLALSEVILHLWEIYITTPEVGEKDDFGM